MASMSMMTLTAFVEAEAPNMNRLFVPFADATTGSDTYSGGRFIDLDRTPLSDEELGLMATRICAAHRIAYPDALAASADTELIRAFVDSVIASRAGVSKPRLLARVIVISRPALRNSPAFCA